MKKGLNGFESFLVGVTMFTVYGYEGKSTDLLFDRSDSSLNDDDGYVS